MSMIGGTFNSQSLYSEHRGVSDRGDSYHVADENGESTLSTITTLSMPSPSASRSSSLPSTPPIPEYCPLTCNMSNMEPNCGCDREQYPTRRTFESIVQDYLERLSSKKRDKALVNHERYSVILQVLKDPRNTSIGTAQFRFWVKKMFQLSTAKGNLGQHNQHSSVWVVCHHDKPVAIQEQIYDILIQAHREALHGGRDKTSALVRKHYSWIPKELTARFVQNCPFCISRRNGLPGRPTCNQSTFLPPISTPTTKNENSTFIKEEITGATADKISSDRCNQQNRPSDLDLYDDSLTTLPLKPTVVNYSCPQHQQDQPVMAPSTPTDAITASANVSTQWMEPGAPIYYYAKPPSHDMFSSDGAMDLHPHDTSISMGSCAYTFFVDHQTSPSDTNNNNNNNNMVVSPSSTMDSIISQCQQVPAQPPFQSKPYPSWPFMTPFTTTTTIE